MNKLFICLMALFFFSCSTSRQDKLQDGSSHNTVAQLLEHFKEPPMSYAPMPLFVWNGKVTKEELDIQLADLKAKGFGGVFVHPRPGLITEYLSDEWFDLFGYTLERCKELGLEVWIYDENSYPSGFAGGHVPDRMPSSYNEGTGLKGTLTNRLPQDLSPYAVILQQAGDIWEDITSQAGKTTGQGNKFYLFEKTFYPRKPWNAGFPFVDVMKPGVTEAFLDITMTQGYEKRFNSDFGGTIQGMFSDEPCIYAPDWTSIRWTPGLFDAFRQKWGYDLKPHLPSLIEEKGNWKEVRHNYYSTLLQLFIDHWSKPMSAYCDKYQLKWTGHYWEHEWPDPDNCPDNMAMYAYHQVPAIDLLFNSYDEEKFFPATPNNWPQPQFGCVRNVKELSSVANQLGKERSLCEMFGAGGWELTFHDMKRLGDWSYVLGVNFLCQHLSFMTIQGARKYDHPASYSYHEPWWEHYRVINDYFRRLSFALTSGNQINKTLIIEPTTTAWMYTQKGTISDRMVGIGKSFQDFLTVLEKQQVEYDLASEQILAEYGAITDGRLQVGNRIYDRIVIPSMTENLNAPTVALLNTCPATKIFNMASAIRVDGKELPDNTFPSTEMTEALLSTHLSADEWQMVGRDTKQGNLYHQRRVLDDGQLLFFTNASTEEKATGTFRVKGGQVWCLDPQSGDCSEYMAETNGGYVTFPVNLPPSGSMHLVVSAKETKGNRKQPASQNACQLVPSLSGISVTAVQDNVLTLDFCDLSLDGKKYSEMHTVKASDMVFRHYGFPGNPWNSAVQFKDEWVKHQFSENSGYEVVYRFSVEEDVDLSSIKLVVEDGATTVKMNGHAEQQLAGQWWLDRNFRLYPVGNYIYKGTNEITVSVSPMHVFAEIEPVYLLGQFGLKGAAKGWTITAAKTLLTGSWRKQGMPFYANAVDYTCDYMLDTKESYQVRLSDWNGTVAEVLVNGQSAGVAYAPPFVVGVNKDLVVTGKNQITVRVFGSNKNLLGPFHGNLPEGLASPGQWMGIDGNMPEGITYQQLDYGLFDNFKVEKRID